MEQNNNTGQGIYAPNAGWTFGADTPKNFDSHVERSIPYYHEGHELVAQVSDFFIKPDSIAYEIGSSTGALTLHLAKRHASTVKWIGIEEESGMVEQANKKLNENLEKNKNVCFLTENICFSLLEKSDFIVSFYTLQFIAPRFRQEVLNKIYQALNWGGGFILFEKVRGPDARFQDIFSSLYTEFKLKQGFKSEEIIAKSRSLKGILEPFSTQGNQDLLKRAGFSDISTIFKFLCFEGFLCIK